MTAPALRCYAPIDEYPFHFGEWVKTPVETENIDPGGFLTVLNAVSS
jgi:hypothetical protein